MIIQSGEEQQSRWDKGKGKKGANWTRDMKGKGFHLTIVILGVITDVSSILFYDANTITVRRLGEN